MEGKFGVINFYFINLIYNLKPLPHENHLQITTAAQQHSSTAAQQHSSTAAQYLSKSTVLILMLITGFFINHVKAQNCLHFVPDHVSRYVTVCAGEPFNLFMTACNQPSQLYGQVGCWGAWDDQGSQVWSSSSELNSSNAVVNPSSANGMAMFMSPTIILNQTGTYHIVGDLIFPGNNCEQNFGGPPQNSPNPNLNAFYIVTVVNEPMYNLSITGSLDICEGTATYQVQNPQPFVTYTWTISGGTPATATGTSVTVNWTNPQLGGSINLVSSNTCYYPLNITLEPCCISNPNEYLVLQGNITNTITTTNTINQNYLNSINKTAVFVSGDLIINDDFNFNGITVEVSPSKKITVASNKTLNISGTYIKAACDTMWEGIVMTDQSAININDGSVIQDAKKAIFAESINECSITIGSGSSNDVVFNKNYYGIYAHVVPNLNLNVKNANFTCNDSYTSYLRLLPPHQFRNPYCGIYLSYANQANIGSFDNDNDRNYFSKLDVGVVSIHTNVNFFNNDFNAMSDNSQIPTSIHPANLRSTGIFVRNSMNLPRLTATLIGGSSPSAVNYFYSMKQGIYITGNNNTTIMNNHINMISNTGIHVQNNLTNSPIRIHSNRMNDNNIYFIHLVNNPNCIKRVENNLINPNPPEKYFGATAIRLAELANNSDVINRIEGNIVKMIYNGIITNRINNSSIFENQIILNTAANQEYNNGIVVENGNNMIVKDNEIIADNRNNWWVNGIKFESTTNSVANCNVMQRTGVGFWMGGVCTGSYTKSNNLRRNYAGYLINWSYSQGIEPGFYNDNIWTGPYDNNTFGGTYFYTYNVNSIVQLNILNARPYQGSGNVYKPVPFYAYNTIDPNQYTLDLRPDDNEPLDGSIKYPDDLSVQSACNNLQEANDTTEGFENMAQHLEALIRNKLENGEMLTWWLKYGIYNRYVNTGNNSGVPLLIDSISATALAQLIEINNQLSDSLAYTQNQLNIIKQNNQSISANTLAESLFKQVNETAIEISLAEISNNVPQAYIDSLTANLKSIAQECPIEKGPAVYIARALLGKNIADTIVYYNACEAFYPHSISTGRFAKPTPFPYIYDPTEDQDMNFNAEGNMLQEEIVSVVYPNPSNGIINISNPNRIQSIEVFNALGQNVMTLNGQNANHLTLNLDGNSQGIYLLKVFTPNRVETIKVSYSK